jgi:diadenosine tetraphosphatase ApaH/serine/threonine PP2A family protein phosphatase
LYAVISDLHSNLPALEAVFKDIDAQGIPEVICLGDVVGYGPFPVECLRLVKQRARVCLLGNHDEALLGEPLSFSVEAARAVEWTREQMPRGDPAFEELWEYVACMELMWSREEDLFVHGSPVEPTQEYLMPGDDLKSRKYDDVFGDGQFERLLFVGHTHLPCVITPDRRVRRAKELENTYALDQPQAIVNVGSVGQPRDGDPRACYAVVDGTTVRWRRVPYDVDATMSRIREVGLPERLAERLMKGK